MFKKLATTFGIIGLLSCIGCNPQNSINVSDNTSCNITSMYTMIEAEDGFFHLQDRILYYADKNDMTTWVPVCNKPDCEHLPEIDLISGKSCNAYLPSDYIVQKNEKIYFLEGFTIYEVSTEGSGYELVYEIPITDEAKMSTSYGFSNNISSNQLIISYEYLDERGNMSGQFGYLKDDSLEILYDEYLYVMDANVYWTIRGDELYTIPELVEEESATTQILCRLNEEKKFEKIDFPKYGIDLNDTYGSYLCGNMFTYFIENEGFYQLNLETGEKELIVEAQLENSRGRIVNESYMVEYNCYAGNAIENPTLLVYNKKTCTQVELPNEVKTIDGGFSSTSIASDRIFFTKYINKKPYLYYYMINDSNPKLQPCTSEKLEYETLEETTENGSDEFAPLDINVFDNEQCVLNITGLSIHNETGAFSIQTTLDIKGEWEWDSNAKYNIYIDSIAVNGIEIVSDDAPYGRVVKQMEEEKEASELGQTIEEERIYQLDYDKQLLEKAGVVALYEPNEYTNIQLIYRIYDRETNTDIERVSVSIYPQGEEQDDEKQEGNTNVLIENENFTISIEGYEESVLPNDTVKLLIENKTDVQLSFHVQEATINHVGKTVPDVSVNNFYQFRVEAGNRKYVTITPFISTESETVDLKSKIQEIFTELEITEINTIGLLIDVYENEKSQILHSESVLLYPNDMVEEITYERAVQDTDVTLVNDDKMTVIVTGYEQSESGMENGTVNMYVVNKTNKAFYFSLGDNKYAIGEGKVNDIEASVMVDGRLPFATYILPQSSGYFNVTFSADNVTVAESMECTYKIRVYNGTTEGNVVVENTIQLTP